MLVCYTAVGHLEMLEQVDKVIRPYTIVKVFSLYKMTNKLMGEPLSWVLVQLTASDYSVYDEPVE
jgi:hypothetical protein